MSIFAKKITTVDEALSAFNKVLSDLRAVKTAKDEEAAKQATAAEQALEEYRKRVAEANAAQAAAEAEAVRAAKAIAKIEDFVL